MTSDYFCAVLLTTKQHVENPGLSVSSEKTSQKMFIRNDKISKIVNDSDSDVVVLVYLKTRCYQSVSITVFHKENKTGAK
jgi:hypothetical protein